MRPYIICCIGIMIVAVFAAVYIATTYNVWLGGIFIGFGILLCGIIKTISDIEIYE